MECWFNILHNDVYVLRPKENHIKKAFVFFPNRWFSFRVLVGFKGVCMHWGKRAFAAGVWFHATGAPPALSVLLILIHLHTISPIM